GVVTGSNRWGFSPQIQLPTRWFTLIASYYRGADLRWYFAGELFSFYNQTKGMTETKTAPSIDGSAAVVFGLRNGVPTIAPQEPVRTQGGFIELGLPLSRWFNATPGGRNAGWTANLHYGIDDAFARDVRAFNPGGARDKSDWMMANIQYKLNTWVTFGLEEAEYRTGHSGRRPCLPLVAGRAVSGGQGHSLAVLDHLHVLGSERSILHRHRGPAAQAAGSLCRSTIFVCFVQIVHLT